jgi:hypothetical protein
MGRRVTIKLEILGFFHAEGTIVVRKGSINGLVQAIRGLNKLALLRTYPH